MAKAAVQNGSSPFGAPIYYMFAPQVLNPCKTHNLCLLLLLLLAPKLLDCPFIIRLALSRIGQVSRRTVSHNLGPVPGAY